MIDSFFDWYFSLPVEDLLTYLAIFLCVFAYLLLTIKLFRIKSRGIF